MVYHVFNRSIAGYVIFNKGYEFERMMQMIPYYQAEKRSSSFSAFIKNKGAQKFRPLDEKDKLVDVIAYCFMPTHIHLVLKEMAEGGTTIFMSRILNSYSRYFNIKHNRRGPLWEGRYKKVLVTTDEQLLHLTRYVHLNPATAYLVDVPSDWPFSSLGEYLSRVKPANRICNYRDLLTIGSNQYLKFVKDGVSYQRELAKIKHLLLE